MTTDAERGFFLPHSRPSRAQLGLLHSLRTNTHTIITATLASTLLLSGLLYTTDAPRAALRLVSSSFATPTTKNSWPTSCSPADWSNGTWKQKSPESYPLEHFLSLYPYNASDPDAKSKIYTPTPEVARNPLAPLGFAGCTSYRDPEWHVGMRYDGTPDKAHPGMWEYVVRGASYDWVPRSAACRRYNEHVGPEEFVRMLVERGGWLLIGDSLTEEHFFSMSCLLYPHVRVTPDYSPTGGTGPHDQEQNIYLNASSPLVSQLRLPPGFNISHTPLVTYRRADLLFDKSELDVIHKSVHQNNSSTPETLFGPDAWLSFNLSPKTYLEQFMRPLPDANYRKLIVSTGGHWTTGTLPGARDPNDVGSRATNPAVHKTFVEVVRVWTQQVSDALSAPSRNGQGVKNSEREVLIRAYTPGHENDCHIASGPIEEVREFSQEIFNWSWIGRINEAFKATIARQGNSQIKYLGLDRMALLRPDAHTLSDCLHIQIGAGIFEGWSRYIWHLEQDMSRLGRT